MHTNRPLKPVAVVALAVAACLIPGLAAAFDSGSTGVDGAFNPTLTGPIQVPPSGIFNYTTVNIPAGVTVTYLRNAANTPVTILASGNVTIAGTISVSGNPGGGVGAADGGSQADDGQPGQGGPGGFGGGVGGIASSIVPSSNPAVQGGAGFGPGGGGGGDFTCPVIFNNVLLANIFGGAGGGYNGGGGGGGTSNCTNAPVTSAIGGSPYGSSLELPLIGGSGGGGGSGGPSFRGAGGGGGGGALLIASNGTISVTGAILAAGGNGGNALGAGVGGPGGGGSGGAIRLIAGTISGNGTISAGGGPAGTLSQAAGTFGGTAFGGAAGFVRLEADINNRTAQTTPAATTGTPGPVFVAGAPTLTIASVAGFAAPALPTGNADITLPATTPNPVTVVFTTTGVPVGNIVQLRVIPANGVTTTVVTPALVGSTASATANVAVTLPVGSSVLQAQTTFTVVAALGDLLKNFAGNERVERIRLTATLGGKSQATLITASGREYDAPVEALKLAALGG